MLRMVPVAFLVLNLLVVLHEGGHSIVALLAGSRITEFDISLTNAHMSYEGGHYSPFMEMWLHANGTLLPLLSAYVFAAFYKKEIRNWFYRVFSFFFFVAANGSLIVWVMIPILHMSGQRDPGEDGCKFVDISARYASPLIVSAAALILIGIGAFLLVRKGILRSYIEEIRSIRNTSMGRGASGMV